MLCVMTTSASGRTSAATRLSFSCRRNRPAAAAAALRGKLLDFVLISSYSRADLLGRAEQKFPFPIVTEALYLALDEKGDLYARRARRLAEGALERAIVSLSEPIAAA
jgi:hypothetical protein